MESRLIKRFLDLTLGIITLLTIFPLLILVGALVKLTSKGPILFRQKRLTKNMREFQILKFRTMSFEFDKKAVGVQIRGDSPEITKLGLILRRYKIDELPQLINIIKGDMSFVGPRPELPRRLGHYSEDQKEIFAVRSGITSPASIVLADEEYLMMHAKNPEDFYITYLLPYKIKLNQYYLRKMNLYFDLMLIFVTVLRVFGKNSTNLVVSDSSLKNYRKELINIAKAGNC